jgi:hypothetical protein
MHDDTDLARVALRSDQDQVLPSQLLVSLLANSSRFASAYRGRVIGVGVFGRKLLFDDA